MAKSGADIFDGHDRAEEAQHVAHLYRTLPETELPGLYGRQRQLALDYLAPAGAVLTPSQQAAKTLLEAVDDLLALGEPDTAHKRACRTQRQHAALLAHGSLHATATARDSARQAGTRRERRPEITAWIEKQLARSPDAKSPELWAKAPDWITDQIGYRRFAGRVTRARKTRK